MPRIRSCIAGAVALVAVSCQDHSSPTAALPPLSADFKDALHRGGNPHFFLLPPFVSMPDLTKETFESGLKPSVRVTELPGAAGTAFAGCTDEQITYLPATEFTQLKAYAAFWRPANFANVAAPCIYRLQVEVFGNASPNTGAVLGFADVQVISKTTIKSLKSGEYIPLPKDLTLPFWFFIGQGAVFYAQTGGTDACRPDRDCAEAVVSPTKDNTIVTKNQKAGIFIPTGAFASPVTLVIEEQTARPCIDESKLGLQQFAENRKGCYRYQRFPSAVPLTKDLTVAMCVEIGLLAHDQAERLQIFRFDPDEDGGTATALQNAPAGFLPCETTRFGLVPRLLNDLAALFGPRALHAATAVSLIHIGVGGSCLAGKCLSSPFFTWGIPGTLSRSSADPQTAPVGTAVGAAPSVQLINPGHPADVEHVPPIAALAPAPIAGVPVTFRVSAGGSITVPGGPAGTTLVVTTGLDGVATLGSWTLSSTPGANAVVAEVPGADGSPVTFTATGAVPATLIDCGSGISGDLIGRGFYVAFPGTRLDRVTLYLSALTAGTYTFSLTARGGTYDGSVLGTATATVPLTSDGNANVATTFVFPSPGVTSGSIVTFAIVQTGGPTGATVFYAVPPTGDPDCPVVETEGTRPPLDTFRRQGVNVKIEGAAPVIL